MMEALQSQVEALKSSPEPTSQGGQLIGVSSAFRKAYRNINWRLTAAHASGRDVHREHEDIFRAAIDRQEARAALALEAHVRLTHDIVRRQAQLG